MVQVRSDETAHYASPHSLLFSHGVKGKEFLDQLNDSQLFRQDSFFCGVSYQEIKQTLNETLSSLH
jgi:hypothetical protein